MPVSTVPASDDAIGGMLRALCVRSSRISVFRAVLPSSTEENGSVFNVSAESTPPPFPPSFKRAFATARAAAAASTPALCAVPFVSSASRSVFLLFLLSSPSSPSTVTSQKNAFTADVATSLGSVSAAGPGRTDSPRLALAATDAARSGSIPSRGSRS